MNKQRNCGKSRQWNNYSGKKWGGEGVHRAVLFLDFGCI
jgi:hypothetical protein